MSDENNESISRDLRFQTKCQMIIAAVAITVALYWLRSVLVPFVLALFLVCGIAPLLDVIQRRLRAPRIVAVAAAFLGGIALLASLWLLVWLSVGSLIQDADTYQDRLQTIVTRVASWFPDSMEIAGVDPPSDAVTNAPGSEPTPDLKTPSLNEFARKYIQAGVANVAAALMDFLGSTTMVLIFMFFLLLGGSSESIPRSGMWLEIESKIRGYIVTKTVISLLTGGVFGLVLWLFGIPLALVFALLAFVLNFIPNVGPILASLLPIPLIVLSPDLSIQAMVGVIVLISVIQFTSGNVVEPKIMGDSFELHPVVVLLTLMVWGMMWGIIGMILATPITAAIKILLERFDQTRPIADLLAGHIGGLQETA